MIDTITSTNRQLISMGYQCDHWAPIVMNLLARKLPKVTMGEWEQARRIDVPPSLDDLITFLEGRARLRVFSAVTPSQSTGQAEKENKPSGGRHYQRGPEQARPMRPHNVEGTNQGQSSCLKCRGAHPLFRCPELTNARTVQDRRQALMGVRACWNCLQGGHLATHCPKSPCMKCNIKHNRLLCPQQERQAPPPAQVHHAGAKRSRRE